MTITNSGPDAACYRIPERLRLPAPSLPLAPLWNANRRSAAYRKPEAFLSHLAGLAIFHTLARSCS